MNVHKIKRLINKFKGLRWFSRMVVILATGTSIWSNWLHSEKTGFAIAINVAPPILMLMAYEMTSRIALWGGRLRRWIRPLTMVAITGINAWLSYWHQHDAFLRYSKDKATATLLPLAIDGLMIIASVAVMDLNQMIEQHEAWIEAGEITTYKPAPLPPKEKDPELPKPKVRPLLKKERIVELLTRYPEMKLPEIAEKTGAGMNYVYAIRNELAALQEQRDAEAVTV